MAHKLQQTRITQFFAQQSQPPTFSSSSSSNSRIVIDLCSPSDLTFTELCSAWFSIESTKSRNKIAEVLGRYYCQVLQDHREELLAEVCWMTCGEIDDAHNNLEWNVGPRLIVSAICSAFAHIKREDIRSRYKQLGDLALVVEDLLGGKSRMMDFVKKNQTRKELLVGGVFTAFRDIAKVTGDKMRSIKMASIVSLLRKADPSSHEIRYLIRLLNRDMRIGVDEITMVNCLSRAFFCYYISKNSSKSLLQVFSDNEPSLLAKSREFSSAFKKAYYLCPDLKDIIQRFLEYNGENLENLCRIRFGCPVSPMLAQATKFPTLEEFVESIQMFKKFSFEFKYDGQRAQIHFQREGKSIVFSRNMKEQTQMWPEIDEYLRSSIKSSEFTNAIIDTEVVAIDFTDGEAHILPFQVLSSRSKIGEKRECDNVRIMLVIFDVLYLNNESLVNYSLEDRRRVLKDSLSEVPGKVQFAKHLDFSLSGPFPDDFTNRLKDFFHDSIQSCEGLIFKLTDSDSKYEAALRSAQWIKIKKDYILGHEQSLDLIPLGGWYGNGRKAGWLSPILMGLYDPSSGNYYSVCKVMSGFSDDDYKEISSKYLSKESSDILESLPSNYQISDEMTPTVLFRASEVWEIKGAEFSLSPVHTAGLGMLENIPDRGISLRFPRFVRKRPDKSINDACSVDELLSYLSL
jgi:DNA ligase-1